VTAADRTVQSLLVKEIHLTIPASPQRTCFIIVGSGALDELPHITGELEADLLMVLCDEGIAPLAGRVQELLPEAFFVPIPSGEASKSFSQVERIIEELVLCHASTQSVLINVGGGMVTDLGGFTASVFARGIRCVHVPTNLLGMADASIGGKTYVNVGKVKNMVGTLWYPSIVLTDTSFLQELPQHQLEEGLVEVLKVAALTNAEFFGWMEEHVDQCLARDPEVLEVCVQNAVQAKVDVLEQGAKDGHSSFLLNFGHTVGHAIEALSHFSLSHAEAVSIGMLIEMTVAGSEIRDRIAALLMRLSMPIDIPPGMQVRDIWEVILSDKNVRSDGDVRIAVPQSIGGHGILPMTKEQLLAACK